MEAKPRYEFRVWGETLADLRKKLEGLVAPDPEPASEETYLVSGATDECNVKIRAGLMDIKIMVNKDRDLEQWKPILKATFPLDRSAIATKVFPSLGLDPPQLSATPYSIDEFMGAVIPAEKRIATAQVSKLRLRFNFESCQAEFAAVNINDAVADTVAVESVDAWAVRQMMRLLGIESHSNTSYVRRIKQVLGMKRHEESGPA
jgi:exopolyphosphatase / guanosine-5'-triphosphate,3'-diphosphate pyrophosphatase